MHLSTFKMMKILIKSKFAEVLNFSQLFAIRCVNINAELHQF